MQPIDRRLALVFQASMCLIVGALVSCSPDKSKPATDSELKQPVAPEDRSLTIEAYLQLGMPSPDREWNSEDYEQAVIVLKSLATQNPLKLPRYDSKVSGKMFQRIVSRENLAVMLNRNLPLNTRFPLVFGYLDGVKKTLLVYYEPATRGVTMDTELVEVMGLLLKAGQESLGLANEFVATIPKDDPKLEVRMQGFAKMKIGLVGTFDGAILSLSEKKAYRTSARIRLCGYLQETLPSVIGEFPATVQTEIPLRIKRMQENETDADMKKALADLYVSIANALSR
jgi:hypothetical protein